MAFLLRPLVVALSASLLVACDQSASVSPLAPAPAASTAVQKARTSTTWPADSLSAAPCEPFGIPTCASDTADHTLIRHYAGFDLDYDDRILAPRWTAYKLTSAVVRTHKEIERESKFWGDPKIEAMGLRITAQMDYNNPKGTHVWDRGHMVPFNDARCWGQQSAHDCFTTANIVPQDKVLNEQAWEMLEQRVDAYAKLKGTIWVFTGPIYDLPLHAFAPHRPVPAPDRLYKVVVWQEKDDSMGSVAWIMPNAAADKQVDLDKHKVSIADVEHATGVKFLPGR
jgi:endonuclease G